MTSLEPAHVQDPRLTRLFELAAWFRSIGCCYACSLELALLQVGRETGDVQVLCPGAPPIEACRGKARARWHELPPRLVCKT